MKRLQLFAITTTLALVAAIGANRPVERAKAQTTDFDITWQATDLIVARLMYPQYANNQSQCTNWTLADYGTPANSEVAIGVSKWTVKGQIRGSAKFKELWSTANVPNAFTYTGDFVNGACQNGRLYFSGLTSTSDWLAGYTTISNLGVSAMQFRAVPADTPNIGLHNLDVDSTRNIGRTNSCQRDGGDTSRCIIVTGPYSWQTVHKIQSAQENKHMNIGTLIPLKWTVTGFLCEGGDNRCD